MISPRAYGCAVLAVVELFVTVVLVVVVVEALVGTAVEADVDAT